MNKDVDTETEILAKLGILNSTIESPKKMTKTESRRRAALNVLTTGSLSDDSDSEIIFDRNALLNARKRRRRQRSTRITNFTNNETLKWKLFCLTLTFLCMGLATVIVGLTKPDIMANVDSQSLFDYAQIFLFGGIGYFVGSVFLSLIFTRINAYICVLFFFSISIPFTTLLIYQTHFGKLEFFVFCQGLMFGAIERGTFFIIYGILKSDKRVLFTFYMAFALGGAFSSMFTTEEMFSRATVISQNAHLISKRSISNFPLVLPNNLTIGDEFQLVTRPHSAVGIDEDVNTKTRENTERRKQVQTFKDDVTANDCFNSDHINCSTFKPKSVTERQETTTHSETRASTPATTTNQPITTPPIPDPTTTIAKTNMMLSNQVTFNRARNRLSSSTTKPQSMVEQMKYTLSDQVHKSLAKLSTASRFAYVLIMAISLSTVGLLILGFCTCCIRCNLIADVRVAQIALNASSSAQLSTSVRLLSAICWFLQALPESILVAFLPHYILSYKNPEFATQNNTAFFNGAFWFSTSVYRAFLVACPGIVMPDKMIKMCYFIGLPFCIIFHYMLAETEIFLFASLFVMGFFVNSLPQMTFFWLQCQLDASPYLLTKYYFTSISLSKSIGPLLTVWMLSKTESNHSMMALLTTILSMSLFFFLLLSRSVHPLARQRQIIELTGDINGRRTSAQAPPKQKTRKGQYEALIENQSDEADVEMDYVMAENVIVSDSNSI